MLHGQPATRELARERPQELVAPTRRRRCELVEEGEIGTATARTQPVDFRTRPPDDASGHATRRMRNPCELHGRTR